jgi:hypothetical protein
VNPLASWDQDLFGIYDLQKQTWTLDCFDDPRVWFSRKAAEEYYGLCKDYAAEPGRFEVRLWRLGYDHVSQG